MAHSGITGNRGLHMQDLWNEQDAAAYAGDLAQRVYSSRLLGRDPALVLHGGGNTSVKVTETNLLGEPEDILYVKGSGWDLESIQESGFAPVRMAHLLKLAQLERLSDPQMVNELRTHMTRAAAPSPSVETILHAILPYKYVDHTHADAVVTVTNTANGEQRIRDIYGDTVVVIPYTMPGFATEQKQFPVSLMQTAQINVVMREATFEGEIVVTSESPLVNTSTTTLGADVSMDFFLDLPTERNYASVARLVPGAQDDLSGTTFYGSTGAENAYYIDGANTTGVEYGTQGTQLNFEFIDEVQVKTGSYNAEYGRATGSVISVITKSGGNEFHGDLFAYFDSPSTQAATQAWLSSTWAQRGV